MTSVPGSPHACTTTSTLRPSGTRQLFLKGLGHEMNIFL
jgi:hypothetical protein